MLLKFWTCASFHCSSCGIIVLTQVPSSWLVPTMISLEIDGTHVIVPNIELFIILGSCNKQFIHVAKVYITHQLLIAFGRHYVLKDRSPYTKDLYLSGWELDLTPLWPSLCSSNLGKVWAFHHYEWTWGGEHIKFVVSEINGHNLKELYTCSIHYWWSIYE